VCAGLYDASEFDYITYEDDSGGLYTAEGVARIAYYGVTGFPTLRWDGYQTTVGAGDAAADGSQYVPIIESHFANTTPVAVSFNDWSFASGPNAAYVDLTVKLFGNLSSITNTYVRVAVVEDHLTFGALDHYNRILRDMLPTDLGTALTIQNSGQEQTLHLPFTMGSWNPTNLRVIAFVQRDSDKFIYNTSSTVVGPYQLAASADGAQQVLADGSNPIVFGTVTVQNRSIHTDTADVTLDLTGLPAGWNAWFTHDGVDGTSASVTLDPFASTTLVVTMTPGPVGSGRAALSIASQGGGEAEGVRVLDFIGLAGGTDVLVVADDGVDSFAYDFFGPAISGAGKTWAVWDREFGAVTSTTLAGYDAVVWLCGSKNPGLIASDRSAIDTYLAAGGHLLVSGQDVIQDLQTEGSSARIWFQGKFRITFASGSSGNYTLNGTAGDPIGDALSLAISGGDGANNQTDPDVFNLLSTNPATPIFRYGSGTIGGTRVEMNGYRAVVLGFGFEAISTSTMRNEVMERALNWLIGTDLTPAPETPAVLSLAQNSPNPFNPKTTIAFALDRSGTVRLAVYDVRGQLVRTLVDESLAAGNHAVVWDGQSDSGRQAASGTYVYRLTTGDRTLSQAMTLLK
jgi:hypothetical protein